MNTKRVVAFFVSLLFCALVAWIGGFNFDHRGAMVAMWTVFSVVISGLACACPFFNKDYS